MEFVNTLFSYYFPAWLVILAGFLLAFVITYGAIPTIVTVSRMKGLNGKMNKRSSHIDSTPLLGGVAVFAGFVLSTVVIAGAGFVYELKYIIAGLTIVFFVGLKDDILIIDPKKKLAAQIMAALIIIVLGDIRIDSFHGLAGIGYLNYIVSVLFSLYVFIVIINSFNLIDGIDGLASGVAIVTTITFGIWFWISDHVPYAVLSFSLTGSLVAFFRFNVFSIKNKIFLGDTGSLIIGLTMSVIVVRFLQYESSATGMAVALSTPAVAIGILIIPLFDTLRAFIIRAANGRSPFKADRIHIHHRLLDLGLSHKKAKITILSVNIFFIIMVLLFRNVGNGILLTSELTLATGLSIIPDYLQKRRELTALRINSEMEIPLKVNSSVLRIERTDEPENENDIILKKKVND